MTNHLERIRLRINRFSISAVIFSGITLAIAFNAVPVESKSVPHTRPDYTGQTVSIHAQRAIEAERVKQLSCMVTTLVGEASSESYLGMTLVATVIMNRVDSPKHENTICGVVHSARQFSMYNEGDPNEQRARQEIAKPKPSKAVLMAVSAANTVINAKPSERLLPPTSLNYHTKAARPVWRHALVEYERVGAHVFYE